MSDQKWGEKSGRVLQCFLFLLFSKLLSYWDSDMNPNAGHVYDFVLDHIVESRVAENDPLPKASDLAARFGVSRVNANLAMKELERQGIVRRRRRVGTVVNHVPSQSLVMHLKGKRSRRVHVMAGLERVPLHWSEATLSELDTLLAEEGFSVKHVLIPNPLDAQSLEATLAKIAQEGSAGLLMVLPTEVNAFCLAHRDMLCRYHRNLYLFDPGATAPEVWPFNVVSLDPFSEGIVAAEYLYQSGYQQIAFWIDRGNPSYWASQRLAGFEMALRRASADRCRAQVIDASVYDANPRSLLQWLNDLPKQKQPTAVAALNDEHAARLLDLAAAQGLSAPEHFGVVGFDNNPRFRAHNLTTVAPPVQKVADTLSRLLSGRLLASNDFGSVVLRLPSQIVERGTCRQHPVSNSLPGLADTSVSSHFSSGAITKGPAT